MQNIRSFSIFIEIWLAVGKLAVGSVDFNLCCQPTTRQPNFDKNWIEN
jgi:hypothetical protein